MKNQFFFVFLLFSGFTFSQQPTEFSFELYFEDAAGMRDTVTLGYDDYATDGIDVIFDEYNDINKAWEPNDLDVRIGDKTYSDNFGFSWLSNNTYLTKRQILNSHCLNYNKEGVDRKSTRLNSSHVRISYAVFCLKKKKKNNK